MNVYEAILKRRTIRRFRSEPVPLEILKQCVNAARLAPCANNNQRLDYVIVTDPLVVNKIFATVKWAGHLRPRWIPAVDERPRAYIVIVTDSPASESLDAGLAAQNILLTALEAGLGSCCLGSAEHTQVSRILNIPENRAPALVIALGYPAEKCETAEFTGSIKYRRDANEVMHVPKKSLDAICHVNLYGEK